MSKSSPSTSETGRQIIRCHAHKQIYRHILRSPPPPPDVSVAFIRSTSAELLGGRGERQLCLRAPSTGSSTLLAAHSLFLCLIYQAGADTEQHVVGRDGYGLVMSAYFNGPDRAGWLILRGEWVWEIKRKHEISTGVLRIPTAISLSWKSVGVASEGSNRRAFL